MARLKTVVKQLRKSVPNTFLVDGGDWSEGNIYYTEGTGGENLRMMDYIGYDAAVVGNHDWINGPDVLLNSIANARPKVALLAANAKPKHYPREKEFHEKIVPYVIREVGGMKIAFLGLLTYELIYDRYFRPIDIEEPLFQARRWAHQLKKNEGVDAVIAISHNSIKMNELILKFAPDVDLVVGAHDHKKLTQPLLVKRPFGPDAWIVEAGCWGQYLGRMDLEVTSRKEAKQRNIPYVQIKNYSLIQLDASIPEDPETLTRVEAVERSIEKRFGPIFSDHIGHTDVEINRQGLESPMGNLATDAYRKATGADVAFDNISFIYGEIHEGTVHTADVFNANPGVYNPETKKTWTIKTANVTGLTLQFILDFAFSPLFPLKSESPSIAASGLSLETGSLRTTNERRNRNDVIPPGSPGGDHHPEGVDSDGGQEQFLERQAIRALTARVAAADAPGPNLFPSLQDPEGSLDGFSGDGSESWPEGWEDESSQDHLNPLGIIKNNARNVQVNGEPISPLKTYKVAMSTGLLTSLTTLKIFLGSKLALTSVTDTGIEAWRAMRDFIKSKDRITSDTLKIGSRFKLAGPDLGMLYEDLEWSPISNSSRGTTAEIRVRLRNFGLKPSPTSGVRLALYRNRHGSDLSKDPEFIVLGQALSVPSLAPGEERVFKWKSVLVPGQLGLATITARIESDHPEMNGKNDQLTRFFPVSR